MTGRSRFHLILCAAALHATALFATAVAEAAEPKPVSLLEVVRRYADTMIEHGRDTHGPQKTGLFLSALDRMTLSPLKSRPAAPGGIRREDRSGEPWNTLVGANPHLDQNLIRVMYALSQITGDAKYGQAADHELTWFFKNAMSPKTSLLPWGQIGGNHGANLDHCRSLATQIKL